MQRRSVFIGYDAASSPRKYCRGVEWAEDRWESAIRKDATTALDLVLRISSFRSGGRNDRQWGTIPSRFCHRVGAYLSDDADRFVAEVEAVELETRAALA